MCRELLSAQTAEQLKAAAANGDTALHLAVRRKDIDMVFIFTSITTPKLSNYFQRFAFSSTTVQVLTSATARGKPLFI